MAESFDIVFHGNSKSECADFIRAVRKYAKQNKKTRDNQWIADEVYDAFAGEALWWYVRLPADVRGDWERLQEALVTRWVADDDDNNVALVIGGSVSSVAILPTAAAAPSVRPSSRASPRDNWEGKVGRVRIRANGIAGVRYLSKHLNKGGDSRQLGAFGITTDMTLALRVRLSTSAPSFYRLELVEHESELLVLAAFTPLKNEWSQSTWGILVGVDAPGQGSLKDRRTTWDGPNNLKDRPFWTETWQIENTGLLKLRGPVNRAETARFAVSSAAMVQYRDILWIVGPKASLLWKVETDLEFEPMSG